jgi:hypothetical protein
MGDFQKLVVGFLDNVHLVFSFAATGPSVLRGQKKINT